jgi:PIN domain nuclease of toxin-antitoxin system
MTFLLDTRVLLWWLENPRQLSRQAKKVIEDGRNHIYVSAAVAWEIAIKKSLGKLETPDDLDKMIDANRFRPLPVTIAHALGVLALPDHHRDPFDRILIAQALHEGLRLVTRDQEIAKYPVPQIVA